MIVGIAIVISCIIIVSGTAVKIHKNGWRDEYASAIIVSCVVGIFVGGVLLDKYLSGDKPHNGKDPSMEDVYQGTAHIDTLKATCKGKAQNQLFINWNDSIVTKGGI